ncbi:MAG: ABC transporter permease [Gemmatimonadaceae bacterium]|nr:ABC transporter permease [Gemmatimonadaceae bacterium]
MHLWRQTIRGWRALTRREEAEQEISSEVAHYLHESTKAHRARGLDAEAAERAARAEFGSLTSVEQQVRGYGWERVVEGTATDMRRAVRRLIAQPSFSLATAITLALGIGGTTAIFSAIKPTLLDPLPYPQAHEIALIRELRPDGAENGGTFGMYRELAARSRSLTAIAAVKDWRPTLTGIERPERLDARRVSAAWFAVHGKAPSLGRPFTEADDVHGGPDVVVISDAFWHVRFGGDAAVVGRQLRLDDRPFTIVGVMPPGFEDVLAPGATAWAPLQYAITEGRAWGHHLRTVARLRPDVSFAQATQELDAIGTAVLREMKPETYGREVRFAALPLQEAITEGVRPVLLAMLVAMSLVLVIACVNVTNLVVARDAGRQGEFALRAALGAGRVRLVRQVLTESVVLAGLGGALGLLVAAGGVRALRALAPADMPRAAAIGFDSGVFVFAAVVSALVGLAFGVLPALRATNNDPQQAIQGGQRRTVTSRRRATRFLVVLEVSLAVTLLVCSGLLLRSLTRVFSVDAGFVPDAVLTMQLHLGRRPPGGDSAIDAVFQRALAEVQQVPGVASAALTSQLPLSGDQDLYGVQFEPVIDQDPGELRGTYRYGVSTDYFATMGIALRRGRLLGADDDADAAPVALVSESLARRRLPGLDPIGRQIRVGPNGPFTLVGVVADVKQVSLALHEPDAVYVPAAQWAGVDPTVSLVVKGRSALPALDGAVREAVWSADADLAIARAMPMAAIVADSASERRFALIVFEAFALTALLLAAAGIYGVLAGNVAERTREIGVRTALGAPRGSLLRLVGSHAMRLTVAGVALGAIGAVVATRMISGLLFEVSALDATTYLGVIALLSVVASVAAIVPAWRAIRIDPASTLRSDQA